MERRKVLRNEYKQRKTIGGIYRVTNMHNGMCLLDYAVNIQGKQNVFDFMVSSGSCFDYRLKEDLQTFGSKVFTFEILETLEKKNEQTQDQFIDDLNFLFKLWSEKDKSSKRY
jgi:hypothetical protein